MRHIFVILAMLCAGLWAQKPEERFASAERLIEQEQFAAAETMLGALFQEQPKNVEYLYRLGYVQFRQRNLAAARQTFLRVVEAAPPALYSRYFLGRISLLENQAAEAVRWLEPVAAAPEPVFDALAQLSGAYVQVGQMSRALASLQAAVRQAPWDGALYFRLGQLQQRMGQKEAAQASFASSSRLKNANREDVEQLMAVGAALRKGDVSTAFAAAARIEQRQPPDPGALVALGVLYGQSNLDVHALSTFEAATKLDPKLAEAHLNRGLAHLKRGEAAPAAAALAEAVKLMPQSMEANRAYGLALTMAGKYEAAVAPLERVWTAEQNPRVGGILATAYLRTGAAAKAIPLLRQVTADSAADPGAWLLLVDAQTGTEDFEGALVTAQAAQKRFPSAPQPVMAEAQQLVRLGRYQAALPAWKRALQLKPDWIEAELGLADCLQKSGEHEAALAHYRAALQNPETSLAAQAGMARSLIVLRRFEEARQLLEQAVRLSPESIPLRQELSRVYGRLGKADLASEQARVVDRLRGAAQAP